MKNSIVALLGMLGLCTAACEKELDTYSGDSGIYFDTQEMRLDTVKVAWGLNNTEVKERTIELKVCLYGNTADYDRKFSVEVVTEPNDILAAQENVDYRSFAKEYVMPARAAETLIRIDLLRTDVLKKEGRRFTVKLIPTDELRFIYTRETNMSLDPAKPEMRPLDFQRVIFMDESFPMPRWWYVYGDGYFGPWTATKATLICDVMKIDREEFVSGNLAQGYLKYVGKHMHRWLQEHPQKDEDGKPMEMGELSKG